MADTDLVFGSPASEVTTDLVFGAEGGGVVNTVITVSATIPLAVSVHAYMAMQMAVSAVMPAMGVSVKATYVSGASRPDIGRAATSWQAGLQQQGSVQHPHTAALPMPSRTGIRHQQADKVQTPVAGVSQWAEPLQSGTTGRHQDGVRSQVPLQGRHQDGVRTHSTTGGRFQQGVFIDKALTARFQDGLRDRRNRTAGRWQDGVRKSKSYTGSVETALHLDSTLDARHQEAMKPPPGIWDRVIVVPPVDPCYVPSGHLVFETAWDGSPNLVFVCDEHGEVPPPATVVVPVKRVYVVLNNVWLRRVDGDIPLPTFDLSMSLDRDSWTWSFSASLPTQALAYLEPSSEGDPVEVEASINGTAYRFLVESRRRERSFGKDGIRIGGRGKSAYLDGPYAPILNFTNDSGARTAQQLMNDALTLNGVSIGWDVDFGLVDWTVPTGAWAHQGSYISAVMAIAAAAGGYVQPVPTAQTLRILPSYPDAPWDWAGVTPDYELPSSLTTTESTEWVERPRYNRVYVSGMRSGDPLGRVTRDGTAGDLEAPGVVDALITQSAAARQRGISILSNTGAIATVGIKLPVLPETGIIVPGKYVRYTDGGTSKFGITRGVQVSVGLPEVWQSIEVETHA